MRHYEGDKTDFYLASKTNADVVNLAIDLGRPLLVEGEPGCGKTQLAYSIAAELGLGEVVKISVKSGTRAQDLLWRLNALARLQDAQRQDERARYVYPYITLGLLGAVLHSGQRRVVLIDEVDKADIDFPNDLLDVLDTFSFQIDDLPPEEEEASRSRAQGTGFGRTVQGQRRTPPIVVLTSNREKRLPEPFLRRCLYVRVSFPQTAEDLREIVRRNTRESLPQLVDGVLNAAVRHQAPRLAAVAQRGGEVLPGRAPPVGGPDPEAAHHQRIDRLGAHPAQTRRHARSAGRGQLHTTVLAHAVQDHG